MGYEALRHDEFELGIEPIRRSLAELKSSVIGLHRAQRRGRDLLSGRSRFIRAAAAELCRGSGESRADAYKRLLLRAQPPRQRRPAIRRGPALWPRPTSPNSSTNRVLASQLAALAGVSVDLSADPTPSVAYRATEEPHGDWIGEGLPIPVNAQTLGAVTLSRRKLGTISVFTHELRHSSTANVEAVIGSALEIDLRRLLDRALVSDQPATATRPAGLRSGLAPLTPAAAGPGAMLADLKSLAASVLQMGGTMPAFLVSTVAAMSFATSPGTFAYAVLPSSELDDAMLICVDAPSFVFAIAAPSHRVALVLTRDHFIRDG
ncbi:phage major capsid protein [Mesorhizobium sp. LHD-90]|uniref:phage major capsid family protein n=1 Tax=Mesorhizobium sp. LHD-90 TaxID=3071414 RepID=UPI0027E1B174|nr:phage major capsid protein [Mesorhizobium sp. LHD-90]MDQ6438138.1 phage major capsid protein [Mesorhizobium sp. LHD-90]